MWVTTVHSDYYCQRNLWWLIAGLCQFWIQIEVLWAIRAPIKNSLLLVIAFTLYYCIITIIISSSNSVDRPFHIEEQTEMYSVSVVNRLLSWVVPYYWCVWSHFLEDIRDFRGTYYPLDESTRAHSSRVDISRQGSNTELWKILFPPAKSFSRLAELHEQSTVNTGSQGEHQRFLSAFPYTQLHHGRPWDPDNLSHAQPCAMRHAQPRLAMVAGSLGSQLEVALWKYLGWRKSGFHQELLG